MTQRQRGSLHRRAFPDVRGFVTCVRHICPARPLPLTHSLSLPLSRCLLRSSCRDHPFWQSMTCCILPPAIIIIIEHNP